MKKYVIFTDGSCNAKTKQGGSGVFIAKPKEKRIGIGYCPTRTGRTEVNALLLALKEIPKDKKTNVLIYSDSQYVVKSIMENWVYNWEKMGWIDRKNVDLWKKILKRIRNRPKMKLKLIHIKGHQKDLSNELIAGNNEADKLASYKNFKEFVKTDPSTWDK